MHTDSENRLDRYVYFLVVAAGFVLLRLETFPHVYNDYGLRLIDPDSYYHLRRVLYTLQNYPKTLTFDNFLSYPHGDYVPWPPLFDLFSATLLKPFKNPEGYLPALNLLYFFTAFTLIFSSIEKKEGLVSAVVAGCFLSYAGILRTYTSFGRIDHHALELLLIAGVYLSFMNYCETRKIWALATFTVFTLASFFNWPGALLYFPPIILFVFFRLYRNKIEPDTFKGLFVAFHITAILIALYLRLSSSPDFPPYSYKFLSGFQRDFCFFISVIFITVYFHLKKKFYPKILWPATLILLTLLFHKFFTETLSGFQFIGKQHKLIGLVEEAAPLFFSPFYSLSEEFNRTLFFFTPAVILFPVFLYLYARNTGNSLIILFTLFFLILTFFQLRFGYFFMLGYSVMLGSAIGRYINRKYLPVAAGAFIVLSLFAYYKDSKASLARFPDREIYETMSFLSDKTPEKPFFEKGHAPYGILSSWDLGHYIIQVGKRPAVAHNFIGHALHNGEMEYINAFFSKSEDEVLKIIDRNKARFIVLQDPYDSLITDWSMYSSGENPYAKKDGRISDAALELFLYRLFKFNGATPAENSQQHFRLVYSSSRKNIKVFERVAGVRIVVSDRKRYTLKAKISGLSNSFVFVSSGRLTTRGREFVFPYSTELSYDIKASDVYLESGGDRRSLKINEEDILSGNVINIPG